MPTATEEHLRDVDREVEDLKHAFVSAVEHLQKAPEVDGSFDARWRSIADRLAGLPAKLRPEDLDKGQLDELWRATAGIAALMLRKRDLEALDELLIRIERIRHVIRDALDEYVVGQGESTASVVAQLLHWLPRTSRNDLAELLGIDRRTLLRWRAQTRRPPSRRLEVVARLVAILRHSWTEDGVVAWFHRARPELGGRTPLAVLGEARFDEDALIGAARASRSQYAT